MPRNSSGTMSLPAPGVPFQSGSTISSSQVNATFSDLAAEISDSLSRSGKGGMTASVRAPDGTVGAPAYSFTSEVGTGAYRAGPGDYRIAVGGVDALKLAAGGVVQISAGGITVTANGANGSSTISGNMAAAFAGVDVYIQGAAAKTAGYIADFRHGGGDRLLVDYQGLLTLGNQAAAIQPAGVLTSLTMNTGWSAVGNLACWKDASGTVHIQGGATPTTGFVPAAFTLPAGFRPRADATSNFPVQSGNGTATFAVASIGISGGCTVIGASVGVTVSFDGISFLAGQ